MISPVITTVPGYAGRLDPATMQPGVRHYNPAICTLRGDLLCIYRVQDENGLSRVAGGWIKREGESFTLVDDRPIVIPVNARTHVEDPRLIVIRGVIHLFVAVVEYGSKYHFIYRGFRLDPDTLQPTSELELPYGLNGKGKTEKNWMPFENAEGGLNFVYSVTPQFNVIDFDKRRMLTSTSGALAKWRWGSINGRTNAVKLNEALWLTLVGGHVPIDIHGRHSIYWIAALTFTHDGRDWLPVMVSREPILWGSRKTSAILNPFDANWNPLCLFPGGLVLEASTGKFLVSLGTNDSYCDFLRLDPMEVGEAMIPVEQVTGDERALNGHGATPQGLIRVKVVCSNPVGEPGGPFQKGDKFLTTPERVSALGKMVEVIP